MNLRVKGNSVPQELLDIIADITDHAQLNLKALAVDDSVGVVKLPITRFPLIKRRQVLWNIYDADSPIPATIVVHKVLGCEIENHSQEMDAEQVMLHLGLRIKGNDIYACSAQETHGTSLFSIRIQVSELDLEIIDS